MDLARSTCTLRSSPGSPLPASEPFLGSTRCPSFLRKTLDFPRRRWPRLCIDIGCNAASEKVEKLSSELASLTLEEARTLVDLLQEKLGVSAASLSPAVTGPAAPGASVAAAETPVVAEKTEFNVVIDEVPSSARIATIKAVRALTNLPLKEAKNFIDGLPKAVKEGVSKDDAEAVKKQLEEAGAKVSIV